MPGNRQIINLASMTNFTMIKNRIHNIDERLTGKWKLFIFLAKFLADILASKNIVFFFLRKKKFDNGKDELFDM